MEGIIYSSSPAADNKKAPLAGEATGLFDYHKLYATDLIF